MSSTLQRLKKFIDYKSLTVAAFEKKVGFSNGAFASQLKNNKTIGVDKLENILSFYPELNPEWLLKGTGEMLTNEYHNISENETPYGNVNKEEPLGEKARLHFEDWQNTWETTYIFSKLEEIEMRIISYTLASMLAKADTADVEKFREFNVKSCRQYAQEYYRQALREPIL